MSKEEKKFQGIAGNIMQLRITRRVSGKLYKEDLTSGTKRFQPNM
jgi:hypothetical protein